MAAEIRPNVVEGEIIRTSYSTVILCAVGSALMAFAAGLVLWDTWAHQEGEYLLPFHLAKDSLFTSFVVLLCFVGGCGCTIAFVCQSLFPQGLLFGEEVLQVIRMGFSGQKVIMQIPYSNIAGVRCQEEEHGFRQLQVGIDLHHPDASGMYPGAEEFCAIEENDPDLTLPGFFTSGAEEIARQIADRCRRNDSISDG